MVPDVPLNDAALADVTTWFAVQADRALADPDARAAIEADRAERLVGLCLWVKRFQGR